MTIAAMLVALAIETSDPRPIASHDQYVVQLTVIRSIETQIESWFEPVQAVGGVKYLEPPFTNQRMVHPLDKHCANGPLITRKSAACLPLLLPVLESAERRDSIFGIGCRGKDASR